MVRPRGNCRPLPVLTVPGLILLLGLHLLPGRSLAAAETTASGRQTEQEFRLVPAGTLPLKLAHGFVHAPSVQVFVEGRLWAQDQDYRVRARSGLLIPLRSRAVGGQDAADTQAPSLVMVKYEFLPVPLPPRRDLRPVAQAPENLFLDFLKKSNQVHRVFYGFPCLDQNIEL